MTDETVDLEELTRRAGLEPHQSSAMGEFAGPFGYGPYTEADAEVILESWKNTDPETGVYTDPAGQ